MEKACFKKKSLETACFMRKQGETSGEFSLIFRNKRLRLGQCFRGADVEKSGFNPMLY